MNEAVGTDAANTAAVIYDNAAHGCGDFYRVGERHFLPGGQIETPVNGLAIGGNLAAAGDADA